MAFYKQFIVVCITVFFVKISYSKPHNHILASDIANNTYSLSEHQETNYGAISVKNITSTLEKLQNTLKIQIESVQSYKDSSESEAYNMTKLEKLEDMGKDRDYNRSKRSTHQQTHRHCTNHHSNFNQFNLTCPATVPSGSLHQRQRAIAEWINLISLLDYKNITHCQQITSNVYLNERPWAQWIVYSSCPTNYTSLYNNEHLLTARCACTHRECRQVTIKVSKHDRQWHHPIGCVYANINSVDSRAVTERINFK